MIQGGLPFPRPDSIAVPLPQGFERWRDLYLHDVGEKVIAFVVMAVVLLVAFKVRWRLLPLGVAFLGIIWTFGLFGYTGIPLSLVTISGLPILIGVGIDFAIQMHSRVEEEVVLDNEDHPIAETTRNLAPALIVAALSATFAFVALQFSQVPMIKQWGILLSIGMAMLCFAGILVTTSALGARGDPPRPPTSPVACAWRPSKPPASAPPSCTIFTSSLES